MHDGRNEAKLSQFRDKCREHGLKITPQRVAIYEILSGSDSHPTAEQVFREIHRDFPHVSFDTVNRTLITFARIGLADIVEGYGSPRRYDSNLHNHHHIHCIKCGKIIDFENDEYDNIRIPEDIRQKHEILNKKVVINAICEGCRTEDNPEQAKTDKE